MPWSQPELHAATRCRSGCFVPRDFKPSHHHGVIIDLATVEVTLTDGDGEHCCPSRRDTSACRLSSCDCGGMGRSSDTKLWANIELICIDLPCAGLTIGLDSCTPPC